MEGCELHIVLVHVEEQGQRVMTGFRLEVVKEWLGWQ